MITVKEEIIDSITEAFYLLLNGKRPAHIALPADYPDDEIKQAASYINRFMDEYNNFNDVFSSIARGELDFSPIRSKMGVVQALKNLRSNLKHLTWKTQKIADGDLSQQVDFMGDFSAAFNKMTLQLKESFERIESQNIELKKANEIISQEKEKSEKLLLNILPGKVVDDLKKHGKTIPQTFENVTIFFSDIVGFTTLSSTIKPQKLISELNELFTFFDNVMEKNHCERIKTIGDAYLAVCGMPVPVPDHAKNITNAALEIQDYLLNRGHSGFEWKCRIGIHSGKVVGGVVGVKKYLYDVFGDAINTASRMESNSEPMQINVSEATYSLLKDAYEFTEREALEVKGKGMMKMYFVHRKIRSDSKNIERRKSPRIAVNTFVNLSLYNGSVSCEVVDMSINGGILLRASKKDCKSINHNFSENHVVITLDHLGETTSYEGRIARHTENETDIYFAVEY